MAFRSDIVAGKAVIQVSIQDDLDRQLRLMKSKLFAFSNSISRIGQDLFATGSIGTLGAIFPVKQFIEFQDSMLFLQSKLRNAGVDFIALEKFVKDLGRTTSFTTREVAEGAAVLAQAGVGKGIIDILQPTLDLARGARVELDVAARILTNAITTFGLEFSEAATVASQLTAAARLGTTDIVLIGESMKELGATFRILGVPLEDTVSLISALSNVSLRGTKAGTSFNTALLNLASNMEKLRDLGIVIDPLVDFKDPINLFEKISKGLAGLAPTSQVRELQEIFNIRGARAIGGITVQGLEQLRNILKEVKAATTEARDNAILMDSRLGGAIRMTTSAFDSLALSIGATAEGPLTAFLDKLRNMGDILSQLTPLYPKTTQWLLALPVISLAAGVGLIALSVAASRFAILLTPLVALNGLLFNSFKKLSTIAFSPIAAGFRTIYSQPVAKFATRFRQENEAILKAQTTLDKLLSAKKPNAGNIAQARTRLAAAQAGRSFLNLPISDIGRSLAASTRNLNTAFDSFFAKMGQAYLRGIVAFGRQSRIAARNNAKLARPLDLFPQTYNIGLPPVKPLFDSPIAGKSGLAKQLEFEFKDVAKQLDLDFSEIRPKGPAKQLSLGLIVQEMLDFEAPGQAPKASIANALQDAVTAAVASVRAPASIKADPEIGARIAQALDDVMLGQNIPKQLRGTLQKLVEQSLNVPAKQLAIGVQPKLQQQLFRFTDELTGPLKQGLFDFGDDPVELPKAITQASLKQLDFFKELDKPVQLGLFDNIVKQAPKATKVVSQAGTALKDIQLTRDDNILPDFGLANIGRLGEDLSGFVRGGGRALLNFAKLLGTGIKSINFARIGRGALSFAKVLGSIGLGIGRLIKGLFSLNGLLFAIDFLIIAGPKIAPIKAIFEGIGKAFGSAFGTMRETFAALQPSFDLFKRSMEEFLAGNTTAGLNNLQVAFSSLGEILSTGFALAWERFKTEAERGIIFVKGLFTGLLGTLSGIGDVFGAVAGALFKSRIEGDTNEPFQYGDGPINFLKGFFTMIFGALSSIGHIFITASDGIRTAIITVWTMLGNIYSLLVNTPAIGDKAAAQAFESTPAGQRIAIERGLAVVLDRINNYGSRFEDKVGEAGIADKESLQRRADYYRTQLANLGQTGQSTLEEIRSNFDESLQSRLDGILASLGKLDINLEQATADFTTAKVKAEFQNMLSKVNISLNNGLVGVISDSLFSLGETFDQYIKPLADQVAKAVPVPSEEAITRSREIAKSLSGTVDQVRGQLYQAIKNDAALKEQKKTTDAANRTADGVEELNAGATPFVFGA